MLSAVYQYQKKKIITVIIIVIAWQNDVIAIK